MKRTSVLMALMLTAVAAFDSRGAAGRNDYDRRPASSRAKPCDYNRRPVVVRTGGCSPGRCRDPYCRNANTAPEVFAHLMGGYAFNLPSSRARSGTRRASLDRRQAKAYPTFTRQLRRRV